MITTPNLISAAVFWAALSVAAQAQTCVQLCDEEFWKTATMKEVEAALEEERVDARDGGGVTTLHWAASSGSPEDITLLLDAGADGSIKDKSDETPFDVIDNELKGSDVYWRLNDAQFK